MPGMALTSKVALGSGYVFPAQQFFARCPQAVASGTRGRISRLITALVQAGIWTRLDTLYVLAVESPDNALINVRQSGGTATLVNAPTFTPLVGYTGNGTSSYINTNWNPSTAGGNWTQNSGCMFAWSNTAGVTGGSIIGTPVADTRMFPNVGGSAFFRMNTPDGSVSVANTNTVGLFSADRPNSNTVTGYIRGAQAATDGAKTSQALANENMAIMNGTAGFYPGTVTFAGFGSSLTAQQQNLLYLAARQYMNSVGLSG